MVYYFSEVHVGRTPVTPKDPKKKANQSSDLGKDQDSSSQLTCENEHINVNMQSGECSNINHGTQTNQEIQSDGHQIQVSTHSGEKCTGDTECVEEEADCRPSCVSSDSQRDPLEEFRMQFDKICNLDKTAFQTPDSKTRS